MCGEIIVCPRVEVMATGDSIPYIEGRIQGDSLGLTSDPNILISMRLRKTKD